MTLLKKLSAVVASVFFGVSALAVTQDQAYNISYTAWKYAYTHRYTNSSTYIYIDFTKPSTEKRLYVVSNNHIVYSTYVAHGIGSGSGLYAKTFSNTPQSKTSSLGVSKITHYYKGKYGTSAKLQGLEPSFNNNMEVRDVVLHPAPYIGNGKTGHSWGCFAVPSSEINTILSYTTPNTIIIAYYPNSNWLQQSKFLHE
jgi:hypothetical protein